jgi:GTP cyclohydrolase II
MSEPLATEAIIDAAVIQAVERAIAEARRGAAIVVYEPGGPAAGAMAAEQADDGAMARLADLSGADPLLLLTARRGVALGIPGAEALVSPGGVIALRIAGTRAETIAELADPTSGRIGGPVARLPLGQTPGALGAGAVDLAKLSRLLPAALMAPLNTGDESPEAWAAARDLLAVSVADIDEYRFAGARSLARVAESRVPLAGAEDTRVIAFRPGDGGSEHLALVIGEPRPDETVLVRLHSECFTGDLLGSLRCDCGDQLRGAIQAIDEAGTGILLYLSQEGRGIGLVNKLRAYCLQDRGADTAEANEQLGFDADERIYLPAAEMLRQLGFHRVRLLTNNPQKVAALARCGITVEERVPHTFPANGHNEFYLATKASRFGHQF